MKTLLSTILLLSLLMAEGCASFSDRDFGYTDGWRRAKVVRVIGLKEEVEFAPIACQAELSTDAKATRFAVITYSFGGDPNLKATRMVAISDDAVLAVNDGVLINIGSCRSPIRTLNN